MFTAAFLDAGLVDPQEIRAVPGLIGLSDVEVEIQAATRSGAHGTHLRVVAGEDDPPPSHPHVHYQALIQQLRSSSLDPAVLNLALRVFRLLAEAEAEAHGVALDEVVLHEVGSVDSLVDVVMAGTCIRGVGAERILASPVKLGRGTVRIEHGTHPIPPPASARLAVGLPIAPVPSAIERTDVELSTPTGLAILKALQPTFVDGWPEGTVLAQGSGAGSLDLGTYPNVFRVALLEASGFEGVRGGSAEVHLEEALPYDTDRVVELRCNVDDQTGERTAWLVERALAMGALDGWATPVVGKKGRPAVCIVLLVVPSDLSRFVDFLLRRSSSFGVRWATWDRFKLTRHTEVRETERGPISYSVGRTRDGEVVKEKPEYEDLRRIWEEDPDFLP